MLTKAGGFRLDDPAGEVGIELMFVHATAADMTVTYHVPMTYRGAPLTTREALLIGTAEHGALGRRWVYDGTTDPVLLTQLARLLGGQVRPQHQTRSDEVDDHVLVRAAEDAGQVRVLRVLTPEATDHDANGSAGVWAQWAAPNGSLVTGNIVTVPGALRQE